MKPKHLLCLALVLSAHLAMAASVEIHVFPNSPPDWNLPVSVQVTDADFGKHFVVLFKADKTDDDEFIGAQLDVSSEDNQIASCPVAKEWTTNGVQFEFTVSASNLLASKFRVSELAHIGRQPMPAFTAYWFYLRDFATNHVPAAKQFSSWGVPPEIIKVLPKRIRALRPGTPAEDVWKQLGLAANEHRLSNDDDDLSPDRYRLSWNCAIEFTFETTTKAFTVEKGTDGQNYFKDNRKLIQAILYKNGLEVCHSGK